MLIDKDLTVLHLSTLSALKASWLAFMVSVKKTFLHTVKQSFEEECSGGLLLRFQVTGYAISRWGIEQLGLPFGLIFLLFPMKVATGHAHKSRGKPPAQPPTP